MVNDPQFVAAMSRESVNRAVLEPGLRLAQVVERVMRGYADRPAAAQRRTELVTDPVSGRRTLRLLPEFRTHTYEQLWSRATAIAAEWSARGLRPGDFVAIIGFTSIDYAILDLAGVQLGVVLVPLQPNATVAQLRAIVEETAPRLFAVGREYLDKVVELAVTVESAPPRVVVFDYHPESDDEREAVESATGELTEAGIAVDTLDEVIERGRGLPAAPLHVAEPDTDRLAVVIYTSGSTGTPKGAMQTEQSVLRRWLEGPGSSPTAEKDLPSITVNYMPMSHVMGRMAAIRTFGRGGINYFTARSDLSTLIEDIGLARPTEISGVPRIFDLVYQQYQGELVRRNGEFADESQLDATVKDDIRRRFLGGRVLKASVGSAPISAEVKAFVESCLGIPLDIVYGATEFGLGLRNNKIQRPPIIGYKLVDVPELGYYRTDRPYPRGELLLKSHAIFPGYYNRAETTASVFDEEGYYKTGDIMAEIGPDELIYVDRRNNVQKLSQGEFVTLSRLEAAFTTDPLIHQIYLYGSSEWAYLLAVVVPSEEASQQADSTTALKAVLARAIQRTANEQGLESYEIPRDFLIETEPFSMANGLMSDIRKLLRPRLRERYGQQLEQLYAELARSQNDELQALRTQGAQWPVEQTVVRAARAVLGSSDSEVDTQSRFADLGGDSLSALSFATVLREIFGFEVPVGVVIGPANNLGSIVDYVRTRRAEGASGPTFASVHGADATEVRASDLTLDKFLDPATIEAARQLPRRDGAIDDGEINTVLLTGATGYLGRFMCLGWLEQLAERGGTLVCIVRGTDDAAARKRLDDVFDSGDAALLRHYRDLAGKHLEVFAGDLGEPHLGLDRARWSRLADEVDVIMHPGALVNHVLAYEHLFGPNVVGVAELIRLALTSKLKPLTALSTVGVAYQIAPGTFDETTDVREMSPVRRLEGGGYAGGYSTSKWAGEVLLREAHEAYGLPVTVLRSDMILVHSRYTGQLNVPDTFTRLILSLVATGVAPKSFYRTGPDGTPPRAHYDGLPVDFTAEAVNTLGASHTHGHHTYHLLNPHDDGISLDTFVDWLIEAGHEIVRVDDYEGWLQRFTAAVRRLPQTQRTHSVLPLLPSYQEPAQPTTTGVAPADRFREAVRHAKIGADNDIPHLTPELIAKYVTDLRQLDLL